MINDYLKVSFIFQAETYDKLNPNVHFLGSKDPNVVKQNFAELIETWEQLLRNLKIQKMIVASKMMSEKVRAPRLYSPKLY